MTANYTMYGAPISLYTGKLRSYLIQKSIPYDEVFSSLKVYKQTIIPKTGVRFIPVLRSPDGEYMQDTAAIIERLEQKFKTTPALPTTPKQGLVSLLFEMWADEWLLIPAMHYRWNKANFPYIYQEFGKVVLPWAPAWIRRIIGKKIGSKFKGFVPILGINDNTIPAIEDWFENHVLAQLDIHFQTHDYLLGGAPTLGDYGLVGPLYAHLYMDPAPKAILQAKAPNVVKWLERMQQPFINNDTILANDEIPSTIIPLLQDIFINFWPVVESTDRELARWTEQNNQPENLPRTIGDHTFTLNGVTSKRAILTFHQWKAQRVLDYYANLDQESKVIVDSMLDTVGGLSAMQRKPVCRVSRKNNKLVFE